MKQIIVTIPVSDRHKAVLEAAGRDCAFLYAPPAELTDACLAEADIIVGGIPPAMLADTGRLALLQLHTAGADPYLIPGVMPGGTALCNATGAYGKAVSEHALALTLALMKKLPLYRDRQQSCLWEDLGPVTSVTDAVFLIVGLGDIGRSYARSVKALGAPRVIGVKRSPVPCPEGVDELHLTEELDALLPQADVVVSFLPGSEKGIYTAGRFRAMKPTAYFVNCGRGSAVSPDVLLEALRTGQIAGAAIDVAETEPLPADSPLWREENLLITPHVAGYPHLAEITDRIVEIAADNIRAHLDGRPLRNRLL